MILGRCCCFSHSCSVRLFDNMDSTPRFSLSIPPLFFLSLPRFSIPPLPYLHSHSSHFLSRFFNISLHLFFWYTFLFFFFFFHFFLYLSKTFQFRLFPIILLRSRNSHHDFGIWVILF